MRDETAAEEDRSTALTRAVPWRVVAVRALADWIVAVQFADGIAGDVDLSRLVHGDSPGVFSVLRDAQYFARVMIAHGAVAWPDGPDLAPDAMYRAIRSTGCWLVE